MNPFLKHLYIIIGLCLFAWLVLKLEFKSEVHYHNTTGVDSVSKVKPIEVTPNIDPVSKQVEKEPDKQARKKAESSTIITGVDFNKKKNEVDIQTMDTSGRKTDSKFKLDPDNTGFKADTTGVEEKRKTKAGAFIKKFGKGALRVGEAALVVILIVKATK